MTDIIKLPNGVGDETNIEEVFPLLTPHWQAVLAIYSDYTFFVHQDTYSTTKRDLYTIDYGDLYSFDSVIFHINMRSPASIHKKAFALKMPAQAAWQDTLTDAPEDSWVHYEIPKAINPITTSAWKASDLVNLQIGIVIQNNGFPGSDVGVDYVALELVNAVVESGAKSQGHIIG